MCELDAAHRLTRIVGDLFLLARADAGELVPQRTAIYLEEVVHDATAAIRQLADARNVHIVVDHVIEAPFVGDADLLGQLLLNLLDNAIKHSAPGAGVHVDMQRGAADYEISVSDEGIGIPEADHEHIFTRFHRGDVHRARAEPSATSGAGLGLPIARRFAELHGGALRLRESRPGRTVFLLSLPAPSLPVDAG